MVRCPLTRRIMCIYLIKFTISSTGKVMQARLVSRRLLFPLLDQILNVTCMKVILSIPMIYYSYKRTIQSLPLCKNKLPFIAARSVRNMTFLFSLSPDLDPRFFDLSVASKCNHSIYDYGTFGFWGAFLGERAGKHYFFGSCFP